MNVAELAVALLEAAAADRGGDWSLRGADAERAAELLAELEAEERAKRRRAA
jgi:hypothetical protein